MGLWLRNWEFLRFGISQPFCSCEIRVTMLRNGTRVPKFGFATAKLPVEWSFGCEIGSFSCFGASQPFRSFEMGAPVLRSGTHVPNLVSQLRNGFAAKCRFRRGCEISQTPVFALFLLRFCSERLPFNFFAIPPAFDHPKTYITSKQSELKH
uniref:Uncharacterized protein n=1 Tax=Vitis vinifera TaxID=29760 RepID=A5BQV2_VITVI|nr:hypothetical protein VITISV_031949 [Vitis vinifera]